MKEAIVVIQTINTKLIKKDKKLFLVIIFIAFFSSFLASLSPLLLASITDYINQTSSIHSIYIYTVSLAYIALISINRITSFSSIFLQSLLRIGCVNALSEKYLRYLYHQGASYFSRRNTGEITQQLNQATNDIYIVVRNIALNIIAPIVQLVTALFILLLAHDYVITTLFLIYACLFSLVNIFFTSKLVALRQVVMRAGLNSYSVLSDSVKNIFAARYNNAFTFFFGRYQKALEREKDEQMDYWKTNFYMLMVNALLNISLFGVSFIYTLNNVMNGTTSVGHFIMICSYVMLLANPIEDIGSVFSEIKQSISTLHNFIRELPLTQSDNLSAGSPYKSSVNIEIKDISFYYPEAESPALDRISLIIHAGEFVTFTGLSGSGKSTLARLIAKHQSGYQGSIKIDGKDLTQYSEDALNNLVYFVTQDEYVFMDTLRFNLLIAKPDATDEDLKAALLQANLLSFSATSPPIEELLNTSIGDSGVTLSGGQRQRLSLARLFLRNPALIIIDEGTASLDMINEKLIIDNINKKFPYSTKINISHRITSFYYASSICVFENGQITDQGSLSELKQRNGYIKRLIAIPSKLEAKLR
jgi:ATP-binding cassette subfamily B protein